MRGTAMYWFLFLVFRVIVGDCKSITEGCVLVATIIAWNMLIDWMTYVSPRLQSDLHQARKGVRAIFVKR